MEGLGARSTAMIPADSATDTPMRCPACGERLVDPSPSQCPLCDFDFGDERVTGADVTPYAAAYAAGQGAWWAMSEWIWFAGHHRLKHLAMMRSSAAAHRFARVTILYMAFVLSLLQTTHVGWQEVVNADASSLTASAKPGGDGWFLVTSSPSDSTALTTGTQTHLWWNPAQALIAAAATLVIALLLMLPLSTLMRVGVRVSHRARYRGEQRMTAAILYSTAWSLPLMIGALVMGLRPLFRIGSIARWRWYPPDESLVLIAGVLAGFGAVMWWFWLLRLGATAPASTRGRVVAFLSVGAPILATGFTAGAIVGLDLMLDSLFGVLNLRF